MFVVGAILCGSGCVNFEIRILLCFQRRQSLMRLGSLAMMKIRLLEVEENDAILKVLW